MRIPLKHIYRYCLAFTGLLLFAPVHGTEDSIKIKQDTIPKEDPAGYYQQMAQLDSLYMAWYSRQLPVINILDSTEMDPEDFLIPDFSDSTYAERLMQIPSAIELTYNSRVKSFIDLYVLKRRGQVELMLGLATHYMPMFEEVLDKHEMPLELKYLPVIESALNPRARSRVGASGLWQFMYRTALGYNLNITSFVDERMDPVKSSEAAALYLKDLFEIYNDWHLVIAAYNCGPGNVNKAIRRAGGKKNYWDIYYHLPSETRGYVPAFIAATYVMNFSYEHNLRPLPLEFPLMVDSVHVSREVHLGQVSDVLGIPLNQLQSLNPQYRRSIIPAVGGPYALVMPADQAGFFVAMEDSISRYNADEFFSRANLGKNPSRNTYVPEIPKGDYKTLTYRVKSGDNLGYISEWYGVGVSNLRYWNNIYGNIIRVGQKLTVYVPGPRYEQLQDIDQMTFAQKQEMIGKKVNITVSGPVNTKLASGDYIYHTVRSGDNLWEIARSYPGVSSGDIMRLNKMANSSLKIGQVLKIKPKDG